MRLGIVGGVKKARRTLFPGARELINIPREVGQS